jgi:hypothetical protein
MKSKQKRRNELQKQIDNGDVMAYKLELINGKKYITFTQGVSYSLDYIEQTLEQCKKQDLKKGKMVMGLVLRIPIPKELQKKKKERKKKKTTSSGPQKKSKRGKNAKPKIRKR